VKLFFGRKKKSSLFWRERERKEYIEFSKLELSILKLTNLELLIHNCPIRNGNPKELNGN